MSSSKARARPPAVEPPSPSTAISAVKVSSNTPEMLIVVEDEDDEDDEVNNLAKVLKETTLYTMGDSETTPYWYVGAV